ncbi:shikimate dehydrogenase [Halococcus thailandensis]|uniref:Shikimate dehydrogenase (NADP(+)) n=1 Tax=Halococcus thailandensis JCM 13552 TaxID=1227457 RepID=M0N334_9EURY|nr:shikimate dehydrogenase [Halococcus thailandensis]EMA51499.1 shikimate 5-dehydrogenase [Halococcus thailandensis JCM 13552]
MQVFGLVGSPVAHSLSPPLHEAAYRELGIDARYVTFEPDPDDLAAAIDGARALGIQGLNVTIPFKRDVRDYCEPDELAARIGAINTLDFGGERVTGHNTDAIGVTRAFAHHDVSLSGRAVVVGAGGAGRAAAFALADEGTTVAITNRTAERAHELASEIDGATGHGLDDLDELLVDADILVNATSVGMDEDVSPVDSEALHGDLAVLDAVYSPIETRLLREAAATGATTIDGGWMLLYQGVAAFERWTGRTAPVETMNEVLRERLASDDDGSD